MPQPPFGALARMADFEGGALQGGREIFQIGDGLAFREGGGQGPRIRRFAAQRARLVLSPMSMLHRQPPNP